MRKNKVLGKTAMIFSAVLLISAGGAVFAAVNETMLTNEINKVVEVAASGVLPPAPSVPAPDTTAAPDFTSADYTVNENAAVSGGPYAQPDFPEAAMTAREAADIAAEYLWRVFDYSSKGKDFFMYSEMEVQNFGLRGKPFEEYAKINPLGERAVWNGYVHDGSDALCFMFSMDAITGEILSAHLADVSEQQIPMRSYSDPETAKFWNENRDEYLKLAKGFAEKHLRTKIVSAEFEATIAVSLPVPDEIKEALGKGLPLTDEMLESQTTVNKAGEKVMLVQHNLFDIRVEDENGKEIIVSITDNTKELYEIYNADAIPLVDLERNAEVRAEMGYK